MADAGFDDDAAPPRARDIGHGISMAIGDFVVVMSRPFTLAQAFFDISFTTSPGALRRRCQQPLRRRQAARRGDSGDGLAAMIGATIHAHGAAPGLRLQSRLAELILVTGWAYSAQDGAD